MHWQEPAPAEAGGKAHRPYEFGVKVSIATTLHRSKGGQFALHAKALPGNPYDGHTLAEIVPDMEKTIGVGLERILRSGNQDETSHPDCRATAFSPTLDTRVTTHP